MATYPSASNFGSGERDSAWFIIHERSGADRLVLTTGRESALRLQRALRGYLETVNPNAASLLVLDGAVGPMTLGVFRDYLLAHGREDIALAIDQELAQRPSKLDPRILRMLLGVAWNVDPALVDLPVSSGNSLPFNRRAPAPRGPGADLEVLRAYMAQSPNGGTFTISRDGRYAQSSRTPIAAAGQVRPGGPYYGAFGAVAVGPDDSVRLDTLSAYSNRDGWVLGNLNDDQVRFTCKQWKSLSYNTRYAYASQSFGPVTGFGAAGRAAAIASRVAELDALCGRGDDSRLRFSAYVPPGGQVRPDPVKQTVIVPPTDPYASAFIATNPAGPSAMPPALTGLAVELSQFYGHTCETWGALDDQGRFNAVWASWAMYHPITGGLGSAAALAERAIFVRKKVNEITRNCRTRELTLRATLQPLVGYFHPAGQIASVATTNNIERSIDSVAPTLPDEPGPGMGTLAIVGTVAFVGVAGGLILWLASPKTVAAAPAPAAARRR